jgi:hypothetical protein
MNRSSAVVRSGRRVVTGLDLLIGAYALRAVRNGRQTTLLNDVGFAAATGYVGGGGFSADFIGIGSHTIGVDLRQDSSRRTDD